MAAEDFCQNPSPHHNRFLPGNPSDQSFLTGDYNMQRLVWLDRKTAPA